MPQSRAGDVLQRYTLLECLGRGGAGVVYAARDSELGRRVAVKLVRADTGGSSSAGEGHARLLREAQAMARLAHPNVVPVYDVAPYEPGEIELQWPELSEIDEMPVEHGVALIMELVEGDSLKEWLQVIRPHWRDLLRVLIPAGRGLVAAHEAGLVHRDFKPGNVLVGDDGRVRVLDFGLAAARGTVPSSRARDQAKRDSIRATPPLETPLTMTRRDRRVATLPLESPLTMTGTVLGTPRYMSPEQHRGEPAGPATDQYAFCVVLYEALFGEPPFAGTTETQLRGQKERGPPATSPSHARVPRRLWRLVTRGLSPNPGDRFESMKSLVSALEDVPRALRRRKAGAGVAVLVLLAVGVGTYGWNRSRARVCADQQLHLRGIWDLDVAAEVHGAFVATGAPYVEPTWMSVRDGLDAYTERWVEGRARVCRDARVTKTETPAIMQWRNDCLARRLDRVAELARQFRAADAGIVEHAASAVAQLPSLEPCLSDAVVPSELAMDQEARARTLEIGQQLSVAEASLTTARFDRTHELATKALSAARDAGLATLQARAHMLLARVALERTEFGVAQEHAQAAVVAAEEAGNEDLAILAQILLCRSITGHGRYDEADRVAEQVGARLRRRALEDDLEAEYHQEIARIRGGQGRYEDQLAALERARTIRERLYPADHLDTLLLLSEAGWAHIQMSQPERARTLLAKALEGHRAKLGESHPQVAMMLMRMVAVEAMAGRIEAATELQQRALTVFRTALGSEHGYTAQAVCNLGMLYLLAGDLERASELTTEGAELIGRVFSRDHPVYGQVIGITGRVRVAQGRHTEAVEMFSKQLAIYERAFEPDNARLASPLLSLAQAYLGLGKLDEAQTHAERGLELRRNSANEDSFDLAEARSVAGEVALTRGDPVRARALLRPAVDSFDRSKRRDDIRLLGWTRFSLARALPDRELPQALRLAQQARDELAQLPGLARERAQVETWLEDHAGDRR